ncbi:MAG: hypothetical protein WAV40_00395 [Microgenomates group bacterium]
MTNKNEIKNKDPNSNKNSVAIEIASWFIDVLLIIEKIKCGRRSNWGIKGIKNIELIQKENLESLISNI